MKNMTLLCVGSFLAATSCGVVSPPEVDVREIQPVARFAPSAPAPVGILRVNTATHETSWEDLSYDIHDGYDIYDDHGKLVEHVENRRSPTDEDVMDVRLPAGAYFVALPHGAQPRFWIEVEVKEGRLTFADVTRVSSTRLSSEGQG